MQDELGVLYAGRNIGGKQTGKKGFPGQGRA